MKRKFNQGIAGLLVSLLLIIPSVSKGQSEKAFTKKYLSELPKVPADNSVLKYRMTAVYTSTDIYGKFSGKIKVSGDYSKGLENGNAIWNNVSISNSNKEDEPFSEGVKQEYMENFRYVPSSKMVTESGTFASFPKSVEVVYAKNLVWDMFSFEIFSYDYYDSLKLNIPYVVPDIKGQFVIADLGNYSHKKVLLCWTGVTTMNNQLCSVIEFTALDNRIMMDMQQIKTRGTEQYWGTILVSMKTKNIEHAVMYNGIVQEIEVSGMKDKFLMRTIRELEVNRIQ